MARGNRPRTRELYNAVLAAMRVHGTHFGLVSKITGLNRHTVRKLYERGWPDKEWGAPLKEQLDMDVTIVRAARAGADPEQQVDLAKHMLQTSLAAAQEDAKDSMDALEKASKKAAELEERAKGLLEQAAKRLEEVENLAREKMEETDKAAQATLGRAELDAKRHMAELLQRAKVDAAETLADEAQGAKFGRKAAMAAVAVAALVLRDAQVIAQQVRTALGDFSKMTPMQAIRIMREMVRLVESAEKSLILAFQAERLRLGEPTEVLGIKGTESSLEEKEIRLEAVQRALAKQRMKLVQGGKDATRSAGGGGTPGAGGPGGVAGGGTT